MPVMISLSRFIRRLFRGSPAAPRWYRPGVEGLETRLAPAAHDTLSTAISVPLGSSVPVQMAGNLADSNQVDLYAVSLDAGDQITADVSGQTVGSPAGCLRIFNDAGRQVAFQENSGALDTSLTYVAPSTGPYYVGVSSNGNFSYDPNTTDSGSGGLTSGFYTLSLSFTSFLVVEAPANYTLGTAQPITANTVLQGTYVNGTTEYYSFTPTATGELTASVTAADGTVFVPRLTLYGDSGQLLIQSDAAGSGMASANLNQNLQPGTYYLGVSTVLDSSNPGSDQSYVVTTTFDPAQSPSQPLSPTDNQGNGNLPTSVAVGDFRDDGQLDIVTANADNTVSVLLGNGDGSFQTAVTYSVTDAAGHGSGPTGVAVGDFNGQLDIVTANADNTVSVLLGNGDGGFQPAVTYFVTDAAGRGNGPTGVAVGDFNGLFDIVTANADNTVSVLLGNGDGSFQPAFTYSVTDAAGRGNGPTGVAVGDFNGLFDIVTANADNTVSVLLGNGDGSFQTAVTYSVTDAAGHGSGPTGVAVGDFNGQLDIVTANIDNTVSVLLGDGDGGFQPAVTYSVGQQPTSVTVGDFNHDGNLDIVTAGQSHNTVSVLLGNGDGTFQPAVAFSVGGVSPDSVAVGDFNEDGNLDIVTADTISNTVSLLLGRGDGSFLTAAAYDVERSPIDVAVGDFADNGILDIVSSNYGDNTVSVFLGNGDGTFQPAVTYDVGSYPTTVAVGDLTGDGDLDLVVACSAFDQDTGTYGVGSVSVLLGRGDGTFLAAVSYDVGRGPTGLTLGDLTGDGHLDIVTANDGGNTVSVLLGRGDGTFLAADSYDVGLNPFAVALGDFNGDGHLDIVTTNSAFSFFSGAQVGAGSVSVLLGNGAGGFTPDPYGPFNVGNAPLGVAVGDFTGTGHLDVVTVNYEDGTASVLLGNGNGDFTPDPYGPFAVGSFPIEVVVGDLTAEGALDIVTTNSAYNLATTSFVGASTVSVLLNNGGGAFQDAISNPVGFAPYGVALGDLTEDGRLDIVAADYGANTVSVLLGEGNGLFQTATTANGVASRNVPILQALTGNGVPDELILNSSGDLLFREGFPGTPDSFAPPATINPGNPARDVAVFQTATGWAVAAVDDAGNTVSIYTWDAATQSFQSSVGFATGNLPVRIAAADLTGDGLDDLVVANDFDDSVTIAIQQPDGAFTTLTRTIGVGPSSIAFANLGGMNGPDIVVSDQVSGDFSILFNDPAHSFTLQSRYRAGSGLFDIAVSANDQTVLSQLQTVGVVAGDFTGSGSDDLVVLNRGAESFTLLPNLGQGIFADPQPNNTYFLTSSQPSQIVSLTLPGDALPSVAILMADLNQIWIYRNNGDGTFAAPTIVQAGNDPNGFAVTTVNGQPALLVGNAYGDILTLLYDGKGGFAPDRADLQNAALAVGTIAATGQQFAVVADQAMDQVSLYYRVPGTDKFSAPIMFNNANQFPLLAPGAVQTFYVPGDAKPYLAVANSLSNDVLIYHYDADTQQFAFVRACQVGDDPVSITVADVNADGIPDLLVANQGSNDVSVLIGSIDSATGSWTETPYQRLNSGGSGPIAVAVQNSGSPNGPNLLVTNENGTVTLLPSIGAAGKGSGFFQDVNPTTVNLGSAVVQSLFDPNTAQLFVVADDGRVSVLEGDSFASLPLQHVAVLDAIGSFLVAGFSNGNVGLLLENGAPIATQPTGFTDQPSALQILENANTLDVFATQRGSDVPIVMSFAIPLVTELPAAGLVGEPVQLAGAELVLVATLVPATLVPATLVDHLPGSIIGNIPEGIPGPEIFVVFLPSLSSGNAPNEEFIGAASTPEFGWRSETSPWIGFPLGADEALQQRLQRQQAYERWQDFLEIFRELLSQMQGALDPFTIMPLTTVAQPLVERALTEYLCASGSGNPDGTQFTQENCEAIEVGPRDLELQPENTQYVTKEAQCATIGFAWLAGASLYLYSALDSSGEDSRTRNRHRVVSQWGSNL
jgi:hypothetical protein